LAAQFENLNAEVIAVVIECTDEQWHKTTESEGWSVAVVAHHIGVVHADFIPLVRRLASGATFSPSASMEDVDRSNAQHALDFADVGKQEALDVLQANGAELAEELRSLEDAQLESVAGVFGGNELTVAQVVQFVVLGHPQEHLASVRATLAA
jgi:hypothetical protein